MCEKRISRHCVTNPRPSVDEPTIAWRSEPSPASTGRRECAVSATRLSRSASTGAVSASANTRSRGTMRDATEQLMSPSVPSSSDSSERVSDPPRSSW